VKKKVSPGVFIFFVKKKRIEDENWGCFAGKKRLKS
jgi:hypothetical protein